MVPQLGLTHTLEVPSATLHPPMHSLGSLYVPRSLYLSTESSQGDFKTSGTYTQSSRSSLMDTDHSSRGTRSKLAQSNSLANQYSPALPEQRNHIFTSGVGFHEATAFTPVSYGMPPNSTERDNAVDHLCQDHQDNRIKRKMAAILHCIEI